jgi:hypothetical protein
LEPNPCEYNAYYTQDYEILDGSEVEWDSYNSKRGVNSLIVRSGGQLTIKSEISFIEDGYITIENDGELVIDGGTLSNICGTDWAGITVEPGGTLIINDESQIILGGTGSILVDQEVGLNGKLYYNSGASIELEDETTSLILNGELHIGDNAVFTFSGDGYISFGFLPDEPGLSTYNIYAGTNSQFVLEGSGTSDKLIEIDQEGLHFPDDLTDISITNGLILMKSSTARMVTNDASEIYMYNLLFTTPTSSRTSHRGLQLYGAPHTISNCTFENGAYGLYGYLTSVQDIDLTDCNFNNNATGLYCHGGSLSLSNCNFDDNTVGLNTDVLSATCVLEDCIFDTHTDGIRFYNSSAGSYLHATGTAVNNNSNIGVDAYGGGTTTVYLYCGEVKNSSYAGVKIGANTTLNLKFSSPSSGAMNLSNNINTVVANCATSIILKDASGGGLNNLTTNGTSGKILTGSLTTPACPNNGWLYAQGNQWNTNSSPCGTQSSTTRFSLTKCNCANTISVNSTSPSCTTCYSGSYMMAPGGSGLSSEEQSLIFSEEDDEYQTSVVTSDLLGTCSVENYYNAITGSASVQSANNPDSLIVEFFSNGLTTPTERDVEISQILYEHFLQGISAKVKSGVFETDVNSCEKTLELFEVVFSGMESINPFAGAQDFKKLMDKASVYRLFKQYDLAIELLKGYETSQPEQIKQIEFWICTNQTERDFDNGLIPIADIQNYQATCAYILEDEGMKKGFDQNTRQEGMTSSLIEVLPNPVSSTSTIITKFTSEEYPCNLEIINCHGKTVKSIILYSSSDRISISTSEFPRGVYIAKASTLIDVHEIEFVIQ